MYIKLHQDIYELLHSKQMGSSRSSFGYFPHLNMNLYIFILFYLYSNEFEAEKPRLGYGWNIARCTSICVHVHCPLSTVLVY